MGVRGQAEMIASDPVRRRTAVQRRPKCSTPWRANGIENVVMEGVRARITISGSSGLVCSNGDDLVAMLLLVTSILRLSLKDVGYTCHPICFSQGKCVT